MRRRVLGEQNRYAPPVKFKTSRFRFNKADQNSDFWGILGDFWRVFEALMGGKFVVCLGLDAIGPGFGRHYAINTRPVSTF